MSGLITKEQLRAAVDPGTFARGTSYFKSQRVTEVEVQEQGEQFVHLRASVCNGQGRKYVTYATLSAHAWDNPFTGNCSCPVRFDCKHSVALALFWLAKKIAERPIDPEHWLKRLRHFADISFDDSPVLQHDKPQLFFEFFFERGSLAVTLMQYRILKNGVYGAKPYAFKISELSYPQREISALDASVLSLAQEYLPFLEHEKWSDQRHFFIKGPAAWFVLQNLLRTERCYYEEMACPLRLGEERSRNPYWEEVSPESYRFVWHLSEGHGQVIALHEGTSVYLDLKQGYIGRLKEALSPSRQKFLEQVPVLGIEQLLQAVPHLQKIHPAIALPDTLKSGRLKEVTNVSPIPEFVLETQVSGQHRGKVRFNYNGVRVEAGQADASVVVHEDSVYRVHRDRQQEQQAIQSLEELGLQLNAEKMWQFEALSDHAEAERWLQFLRENNLWELEQENFNFRVLIPDQWQAEIQQTGQDVGTDWFSLDLGIEVSGQNYDLRPFLVQLLRRYTQENWQNELASRQEVLLQLPDAPGHWLALESQRVALILTTLLSIYDQESLESDRPLDLGFFDALSLDALLGIQELQWLGADELKTLTHQLKHFEEVVTVEPPVGLQATLRSYQQVGLNWLQFLRQFGFHGVLADDMGLGKTLQTLSHLLVEKQSKRLKQALIVAPTSVVSNWRDEAQKFCPDLRVICFSGSDRDFESLIDYDVVITSYALWRRDSELHRQRTYTWLILDEAQNIKNPRSKGAQIAYKQPAYYRLCLTGTPMENHLGELWSLFHFLMPGFLGNAKQFKERFQDPIEKQQNQLRQQALRQRLKPFLLRRHKIEVEQDLPSKTEVVQKITMSKKQRDFYETLRASMHQEVQAEIDARGLKKSQFFILEALLKLRQVCCAPSLLSIKAAQKIPSAKLDYLMELVQTLAQEGRRMLIFSQFVSMLDLIAAELCQQQIDYEMLTGSTRQREQVIERFQTGNMPVFLISLKAGGVGINLTAADTVIHYDPWWNPAVERQATDRSWRLGQDKKVFVYKLIAEDTIEEKILHLQAKKQTLAKSIEQDNASGELRISQAELFHLLTTPPERQC